MALLKPSDCSQSVVRLLMLTPEGNEGNRKNQVIMLHLRPSVEAHLCARSWNLTWLGLSAGSCSRRSVCPVHAHAHWMIAASAAQHYLSPNLSQTSQKLTGLESSRFIRRSRSWKRLVRFCRYAPQLLLHFPFCVRFRHTCEPRQSVPMDSVYQ